MLELMALPNIGLCTPHTFLWIMEKNRNHFNGTLAMGAVDEQIHRMYGRQQTTTTQSSMYVCLPAPMIEATPQYNSY